MLVTPSMYGAMVGGWAYTELCLKPRTMVAAVDV